MFEEFYKSHLIVKSQSNVQLTALCPFHEDHRPSLSVNISTGQFYCHGCEKRGNAFKFAELMNIPFKQVPGYDHAFKSRSSQNKERHVDIYNYTDENGKLLYQVVRTSDKVFKQRRPNGRKRWVYNLKGIERVLYNLPDVIKSHQILIVEGEKDVQTLKDYGYSATTNPGGSGKWRNEYNKYLKDKELVCFFDNDEPGKKHIREIIKNNLENARSIKLVILPVGYKEDVTDYLKKFSADNLEKLIQNAPIVNCTEQVDILLKDLKDFHLTDSGNAEALVKLAGNFIKYDHTGNKFLFWSDSKHHWLFDETGEVERATLSAIRERQRVSIEISDREKREKSLKWLLKSESDYSIQSSLRIVKKMKPVATTIREFDKNPMLLGCTNGIVNLISGEIRSGKPEDYITKSTNNEFSPDVGAPRFKKFLEEIFDGDSELIEAVQLYVGYSITGSVKEQVIFILYGTGENGKSIFLNTIRNILGDYAGNTPFSTFMYSKNDSTKIPNDLAALTGKRFITASEVRENSYLNEARIKSLTGGDPVTARFLHGEFFTYSPTYKIWLAVNHKPKISDTSHGFWRRIRVIPFEQKFSGPKRDINLEEKLATERSGILNWAIQGSLKWQNKGSLPIPNKVIEATNSYRNEIDILHRFLEEMTVRKKGSFVESSQLYKSFYKWCEENGESSMSSTMFGRKMSELGFEKKPHSQSRRIHYFGIGLLEE